MSEGGTLRGHVPTRVLDLSLGGGLFVLDGPLDVGAIHDFALDLAGGTLWVQAEVRRCVPAVQGSGHEVGVAFLGIDPQDQKRLQLFLAAKK